MLRQTETGVTVTVWVVPGASRSEVVGAFGDAVKVRVAAPASGGAANAELCRVLAAVTGHPTRLVAGRSQRKKSVHIESSDLRGIAEVLGIAPD